MKHGDNGTGKTTLYVAPRAGAWIETWQWCNSACLPGVAPRAGAWIETQSNNVGILFFSVAPRAGAWIETRLMTGWLFGGTSPPARGRGLKLISLG